MIPWEHVFAYTFGGKCRGLPWEGVWEMAYISSCVCRDWKARCPGIVKLIPYPDNAWERMDYIDYVLNFRNSYCVSQMSSAGYPHRYDWRTFVYEFDGFGEYKGVFGKYMVSVTLEQVKNRTCFDDDLKAPIVRVKFGKDHEDGSEADDPYEFDDVEGVEGSGIFIFFQKFAKKVTTVPFETGHQLDAELLWDMFSLKDQFKGECNCKYLHIDDVVGCADTFDACEDDEVNLELDCAERGALWIYGDNYKMCCMIRMVEFLLETRCCAIVLGSGFTKTLVIPFGEFLTATPH